MNKVYNEGQMQWIFSMADMEHVTGINECTLYHKVRTGQWPAQDVKLGRSRFYSEGLATILTELPLKQLVAKAGARRDGRRKK